MIPYNLNLLPSLFIRYKLIPFSMYTQYPLSRVRFDRYWYVEIGDCGRWYERRGEGEAHVDGAGSEIFWEYGKGEAEEGDGGADPRVWESAF